MDRTSPLDFDPFDLPPGKRQPCPRPGCGHLLSVEISGHYATITCTSLDCSFVHTVKRQVAPFPLPVVYPTGKPPRKPPEAPRNSRGRQASKTVAPDPLGPEAPIDCPVNDPDCVGSDDERHDACEAPSPTTAAATASAAAPATTTHEEPMPKTPCSIVGCENASSHTHDLCTLHYPRWLNCSKPDIEAWKAAGGPSPRDWRKAADSGEPPKSQRKNSSGAEASQTQTAVAPKPKSDEVVGCGNAIGVPAIPSPLAVTSALLRDRAHKLSTLADQIDAIDAGLLNPAPQTASPL